MINGVIKNTFILNGHFSYNRLYSSLVTKDWNGKTKSVIYLLGLALTTTSCFLTCKEFSKSKEEQLEERLAVVQKLKGYLTKEQTSLEGDLLKRKSSKP